MKEYIDCLVSNGVKPSPQRLAIYEYLFTHRNHPTAETVYVELLPMMPMLSRTTVYNTLRLFCEHSVAQVITLEENEMRFDADISSHAHFKCEHCGGILDIRCSCSILKECNIPAGAVVNSTQLYLSGVCPECKSSGVNKGGE